MKNFCRSLIKYCRNIIRKKSSTQSMPWRRSAKIFAGMEARARVLIKSVPGKLYAVKLGEWFLGECLFCKIIAGEIPSQKVFDNNQVVIIKDIEPLAPVHLLAIPKVHVANVCDPKLLEENLLTALYGAIGQVSRDLNLRENGFRVVSNFGRDAGETIPHFHMHIIAGRMLEGMG